jgi:hypothetical protein
MRSRAKLQQALDIQPGEAHALAFCLGNRGASRRSARPGAAMPPRR